MRLLRNSRGQSLIEYVILVALVGVATISAVRILQKTIQVNLGRVVHTLQGKGGPNPEHESLDKESLERKKDFSDFMRGAVSRDNP